MSDLILQVSPLGNRWQTLDPFLFCVHHIDRYPQGNDQFGPAASLAGHDIGQDFENKDGWSMYHGDVVPGFPQHPHRGFETVTIVRKGYIDHSDSLGAAARFGMGDVQWLTAGAGVVHSEMFPLLDRDGPNTLELFQIWLNLPAKNKLAAPYFTMFWDQDIPRRRYPGVEVTVIAGALEGAEPLTPPPHSWAASDEADVAIWSIAMDAGATWVVPPARDARSNRALHVFSGKGIKVGDRTIDGAVDDSRPARSGRAARGRERPGRDSAAAGTPDRRARRAVRTVRDEHAGGDPPGRSPITDGRCSAAGHGPRTRRCTTATPAASPGTQTAEWRRRSVQA